MTEQSKKIVLPAYLMRRFEAFRIVKDGEQSYILRDKAQGKTHDFDAWQFFILETLPAADSLQRLQTAFQDRFDRELHQADLDEFFGSLADRNMLDESAAQHPLLAPFTQRTYEVEDGKAKPKSFSATAAPPAAAVGAAAPGAAAPAGGPDRNADLPAGVQDALGLDWRTTEKMLGLFDPRSMFRALAPLLRPLRHVIYAVPILLVAALLLLFQYSHLVAEDLAKIKPDKTLFEHLVFVFLTVHVVSTLTAGAVANAFKVSVEKIGITLTIGILPRWVLKMNGADRLTRNQTMWLHGSTLIARMVLFSLGTLVWFNTRDSSSYLSMGGLILTLASAAGLLLEAGNPLIKSNGYYLLAAFLNEPHLRGKAFASLLNKMRGGVYRAADNNLLFLYALLSATYVVLLILFIGSMLAKFVMVDLELGGSAIIIILAFLGYMLWRNYAGLKKFSQTYDRQVQFDRWRNRTLAVGGEEGEVVTPRTRYWNRALVVCLLLALLLPYPYEPGGSFLTYPSRRQVISTDEPGLIESVFFEGGEAVPKGIVLARLVSDELQAQVKVISARIDEQKAVIANMRTLPRPEEVKLAEQALVVQRTRESFSRDKVPRLEKLFKAGAVTFEEFEKSRQDHLTDVDQVAQKEADLALVKVPITSSQIEAAEAKLVALQEERDAYAAKIERTILRMPFDGNILTLHLKDKINSFLDRGAPFAVIEDTGIVSVEIDVPEGDVQYVKLGASVRARPVSYFDDDDFVGKVTVIDRNVTTKSTGNVIKVIATIDNRNGLLKTGMAGRAKITGVNMPVWRAFSLAIVRFIQVQVWSWLP